MSTTQLSLPATGVWEADVAHSTLGFVARHLMVTKVRGHFKQFTATLEIGEKPELSRATAKIDAASITTNDEKRDGHLKSADFFEVEKYPTLDYVSTSVKALDGAHFEVTGDLTIRGVTKPVVLNVEYLGLTTNPWGKTVAALSATGEIDREEWGLTWNQALESGGVLVSKKIQLEIEFQATPREA